MALSKVGHLKKKLEEPSTSLLPSKKRLKYESQKKINYFDRLPDEMVELILDLVQVPPYKNLEEAPPHNVRLVCQHWSKISTPRLQYKGVLNASTVDSFAQLNPEIKLKSLVLNDLKNNRVRKVKRRMQFEDSTSWIWVNKNGGKQYDPRLFIRSVEHLIVAGENGMFLKQHENDGKLPYSLSTGFAEDHREPIEIRRSVKGADLSAILSQLKDVKILTLSSIAFVSTSILALKKINFQQILSSLVTLDICVGRKTDLTKLLVFFENAFFPALTSLYIRVYAQCYHFSLYVNFYLFISKHPTLKNLSLSQAQAIYGLPVDDIVYPKLRVSEYPTLVEDLRRIKLECLRMDCLVIGHDIGQEWKKLEMAFIKNQTELRGLELQLCLRSLNCRLDQILPECGNTLERMELSSSHTVPNQFDCAALSSFTKLRDCHLYLRNNWNWTISVQDDLRRAVRISDIHMLPASIKSLHLGRLPSLHELYLLKERLVNLKRISYSCSEMVQIHMTPEAFIEILVEHLKFPRLVEFRMYTYACPTVAEFLHRQDGLVAYIEDEDSVVVLADREEFRLEALSRSVFSIPECFCDACTRYMVVWN